MLTDDLRVTDRAHQPKRFIIYFQGVCLEPKAKNELLIQHGLINGLVWITMKQMIVFTAHVHIEGTF